MKFQAEGLNRSGGRLRPEYQATKGVKDVRSKDALDVPATGRE